MINSFLLFFEKYFYYFLQFNYSTININNKYFFLFIIYIKQKPQKKEIINIIGARTRTRTVTSLTESRF